MFIWDIDREAGVNVNGNLRFADDNECITNDTNQLLSELVNWNLAIGLKINGDSEYTSRHGYGNLTEYIYIYSHPQTDLFRSIRTQQCG